MTTKSKRNRLDGVADEPLNTSSLVGSFFHSNAQRGWQGCVVAEPREGVYLVELFSWTMGESTCQRLIPIDWMVSEGWQFYDDAEWMRNTYDNGLQQHWDRERTELRSTTSPAPDDTTGNVET